ncbi:MAG: amino acid permease [Candidatus Hydrogenedentes bacterium]|nr:amino acid permease [Candidatus Hydrogenedentota bacterium]
MALKKHLNLIDVFAIAAGTMISSGLFVLPGIAFAHTGPSVILSYLLAGLLMLPAALCQCELATAMPQSGGSYFFIVRSMGPFAGVFTGLSDWVSVSLKGAFALVGVGTLVKVAFPDVDEWTIKALAIIACTAFTAINLISIKGLEHFQNIMIFGLLAILAWYVSLGIFQVSPVHFTPFLPHGWGSMFAVIGMVFVSYGGLTKVANVSGEVRNPGRNIPLGIFLAFLVVNIFYILVVFVTVGVTSPDQLSQSLKPIALGARLAIGAPGFYAIQCAAMFAFVTTALSSLMSAARSPMAMSRDGLLPAAIGLTSQRFHTPYISILITGFLVALSIAFLSIADLVEAASASLLVVFMLINLSVVIMRHSGIKNYRPTFHVPFTPWLQLITVVIYSIILVQMGHIPLLMTATLILVSLLWYLGYVHSRIDREYAFIHMAQRMISREFFGRGLEDELKHIALERDEVELDYFDSIVKECDILDIKEQMDRNDFLQLLVKSVAAKINMQESQLLRKFMAREGESSTVLKPGLAVPHIVVDGEHLFDIVLVRCAKGIVFPGQEKPVTAAFVLFGTRDERNFHLKALMAIAHIVEEDGFNKRWKNARNKEELRDIILLSKRARTAKLDD